MSEYKSNIMYHKNISIVFSILPAEVTLTIYFLSLAEWYLLTMSPKSDGFLSWWQIRKLRVIYYLLVKVLCNWHTTPSLITCRSPVVFSLTIGCWQSPLQHSPLTRFIKPKQTAQSLCPYGPGQKFEYRPGYSQSIKFSLISHKWFVHSLIVTV